ncbi:sugar phosphate isomerase/epimerase family protein [Chitinilyticum litopenaei]|uniref:sugar phosphate isomerase/epimerase family protein n=1 Tax=Chitinilyticum litopenaei TaxID=1121276 RepID=UPI0004012276|nr:TIM barrel protein [Chitinilyticum litopenaei]
MPLACTTRPYQELDFARACAAIAAAGFAEVGIFPCADTAGQPAWPVHADSNATELVAVRAALRQSGLAARLLLGSVVLQDGLPRAIDRYRRLLDHAAALGAPLLLDLGCDEPARYADYRRLLAAVAPHAATCGVTIVVKHHGGITASLADLLRLHDEVASPGLALCFDPGNVLYYSRGAELPRDCVAALAPHCRAVMLKDCRLDAGGPDVAINPGDGDAQWPQLLNALQAAGWDGPLLLECVAGRTLAERHANVCLLRERVAGWRSATVGSARSS